MRHAPQYRSRTDFRQVDPALLIAPGTIDDADAWFEMGCAASTCGGGSDCDLVEAHKWFNIAAAHGHEEAHSCRAEVAGDMTAREIAEAQRRARAWLAGHMPRAA